jgi:hypothetical protein
MNNKIVQCGIVNDCINESLTHYLKLQKYSKKIIQNLQSLRKITDKQLDGLKMSYKEFAKIFFSKKTINCMKTFCEPTLTNYEKTKKVIDEMKAKIIVTKTKLQMIDKNKNYVKLMKTIFMILSHFCKNYKKFFKK